MATKVIVRAGDKPVQIETFPIDGDGWPNADGQWSPLARLEPNTEAEFDVEYANDLLVRELKG